MEDVKFQPSVTTNIKKLREQGATVNLLSCSYGGMSENVSYELLTGGNMNYFPNGYIPIMSLYRRPNITEAPSIIKELNKNGYCSKIVFGKDFYSSKDAFLKLGFKEYEELEETEENKKGYFISDEYVTDNIIKELEEKPSNQKMFYMVETIQNHMPYTIDKYEKYDIDIESKFDEDTNNTLLTYAQGIYDVDKQANRLYEYIKQYNEPTILIVLGDHLPYLYTGEGKDLTEHLSYFNTSDDLENTYRKYDTEALILSNYDINYEKFPSYLSNDLLMTYIINNMDIEIQDYYKWLYTTIEELPATNKFLFVDNMGNKYNINNMSDKQKDIYNLKEMMQYRFFIRTTG